MRRVDQHHRDTMHVRTLPFLVTALCTALACAQTGKPDTDKIVAAQRADMDALPARLAALPAHCTLGNAHGTRGTWTDARRAMPETNQPSASIYMFERPLKARAFHATLNAQGWRTLDKVESRDAHGDWHLAWTGRHDAAPAGCDYVRFEQAFDGTARDVAALRFTLRTEVGTSTTAYVGLLTAD
jgi:hypothetical protein